MNKQFTKDMLVAGKHLVETRNGYSFVYIGNDILQDRSSLRDYMNLRSYSHNLDFTDNYNNEWDIVAVHECKSQMAIASFRNDNLKLIWQREEKSQSQIELEKLQQQISELQEQAKRLEKSL